MIIAVITHLLTIVIVWAIAHRYIKQRSFTPRLAVSKQVSYAYVKSDDNHKKRKSKKGRRKTKKEHIQILTCQEEEMHD
jgi:hypothetical protein